MEKTSLSRPYSLIEIFYDSEWEKKETISSGEIIENSTGSLVVSTGSTSGEKVLTDQEKIQVKLQEIRDNQQSEN